MAEFERPRVVTEGSIRAGSSLFMAFAKILLHGLIVTGVFLAYVIVYSSWFQLPYLASFEELIILFLAFSILEGLVNRKVSQIVWSMPKKSALVDILVRGPVLFAISFWISMSLASIISLANPYPSPLVVIPQFAIWFTIASPFNGLAGLAIFHTRFGVPREMDVESAAIPILGTCPYCMAVYSYSPEHIVDGQARCQNCDRLFPLAGEGLSVR